MRLWWARSRALRADTDRASGDEATEPPGPDEGLFGWRRKGRTRAVCCGPTPMALPMLAVLVEELPPPMRLALPVVPPPATLALAGPSAVAGPQ